MRKSIIATNLLFTCPSCWAVTYAAVHYDLWWLLIVLLPVMVAGILLGFLAGCIQDAL